VQTAKRVYQMEFVTFSNNQDIVVIANHFPLDYQHVQMESVPHQNITELVHLIVNIRWQHVQMEYVNFMKIV
jgi:hypothetical protein